MTSEYSVAELVPHSGKMSLLSEITGYGEDWLEAEVHITADSMFADLSTDKKGVPSWVGMEYLAQAIGAYAGLQERLQGCEPKLGFLVGSRKYTCSTDYFALGQVLKIKVQRELQADNGLSVFDCQLQAAAQIEGQGEAVEASANLNVFQPDDAEQFIQDSMK